MYLTRIRKMSVFRLLLTLICKRPTDILLLVIGKDLMKPVFVLKK